MARDGITHEAPTRRDVVKGGGAVVGGGLRNIEAKASPFTAGMKPT